MVGKTVEAALRAGYKLIDTAHIYCNEGEVGEALLKCFREGVCKREDVFITSKLWWVSCQNLIGVHVPKFHFPKGSPLARVTKLQWTMQCAA